LGLGNWNLSSWGFFGGLIDTSWNSWQFEQKWIFVFWSLISVMTQRSKHLETVLPPLVQQFKKTQEKKKCNFCWFWSETTKFSKSKWSHQKMAKYREIFNHFQKILFGRFVWKNLTYEKQGRWNIAAEIFCGRPFKWELLFQTLGWSEFHLQ
jgi:hypothetical protein